MFAMEFYYFSADYIRMSWCTKPDGTVGAHVLGPKKFYFCAHSHLKFPFSHLSSIEEYYSLTQVVICLLKIYANSWKVIRGESALSLGKCMSNVKV